MRILLLADLHLGARLLEWGEHSASRGAEIRRAWAHGVDLALSTKHGVDVVLVAGDLFDRPDPEPELVTAVTEGVSQLAQAGKKVAILPGLYDGLCLPSSIYLAGTLCPECTVVTWPDARRMELPVGDETLHLYSFASIPGRTPSDPLASLRRAEGDGYHLGLVHAHLEGEPAPAGPLNWGLPPITRDEIGATGLDLMVVGGGHEFRSEICGVVPTVQPGSPVHLCPGPSEPRSFVVAELGSDGVEIERHPSDSTVAGNGSVAPMTESPREFADPEFLKQVREEDGIRGLFARRLETLLEETTDPLERGILEQALALGLEEFRRVEATHAG